MSEPKQIAVVPISDIERMAKAIVNSKFFGMRSIDEAMALMFIAQAEGKHPATAAQEYHVIQGRPALKADAMLGRFQAAGGKVEWKSYTDDKVSAVFSHPQGGKLEVEWTMDRAKGAGLTGKATWKQYPRQMLRSRVISEGIRTIYPGVATGIYTPEEVQDFDTGSGDMIDVTPQSKMSTTTGEVSAKEAYGSAKAMKAKWTEIRDALLNSGSDADLTAVFEKHKLDLKTIKAIDEHLYDSLVQVGKQRREAIVQVHVDEGGQADDYEPPEFLKSEPQELQY